MAAAIVKITKRKSTMEPTRTKLVSQLLLGDIIVETDFLGKKEKQYFFKVTGILSAACSPYKTHITVEGNRRWCYDSGQEIEVR